MVILVNESVKTDPTTGTKKGDTAYVSTEGGYLRFQVATNFTAGQFEYTGDLGQSFEMTVDFWSGGGSGADASYFYWGATATPTQEDSAQGNYSVAMDEFSDQIQLMFNGVVLATSPYLNLDNSTWRTLRVRISDVDIKVYVNNIIQISFVDSARALGGTAYGWAARSGGTNNEHRARNLVLMTMDRLQSRANIALSAGVPSLGAINSASSSQQLVRTAAGNLYAVLATTYSGNVIRVFKSTNNGATWTQMNQQAAPRFNGTAGCNVTSCAIDSTDVIHIAFVPASSASAAAYISFATSTDTFGPPEPIPVGATVTSIAICVDGNNKPHVAVGGQGTYTNRVGGFWKPKIQISASSITNIDLQIDQNNIPQVSYYIATSNLQAAIGNKNNASSFTANTRAATTDYSTNGGTSIVIDSLGNTWLAFQAFNDTLIQLQKHAVGAAWTVWGASITNGFAGRNVSLAADGTDIYIFYERNTGGIAYDRYDSVNATWLGEQIIQLATSPSTTNFRPHNPLVKWTYYSNNGDTDANNKDQQVIGYLFDNGTTVYYSSINTVQISTGYLTVGFAAGTGTTTSTSTSSTSSSTSTSISTSSTSQSTSTSTSITTSSTSQSTSTSTSITTSSTSSSTSLTTSSTSQSTSISTSITTSSTSTSTSTSISTSSTSVSTSSTSTSTSLSTSSTSQSTSISTSTTISTSSTSTSTSITTSSTSRSTSTSSTSQSTSISTSITTSSTSQSTSTSLTTSSTSTSISTSSTSTSISTSSTSQSTSVSTSISTSSTSRSTSTSITTSSTSTSISTSSTSQSTSTSISVSTSSTSSSTSITTSSTSSSISTSISTSSTSQSTSISTSTTISTSSTSRSTSTSISTSSTSSSISTSLSTSSTSTSVTTSHSTSSTSSSTSTTVSYTTSTSSTSSSTSTTTTLVDINSFPRATIKLPVMRFRVRYERKAWK